MCGDGLCGDGASPRPSGAKPRFHTIPTLKAAPGKGSPAFRKCKFLHKSLLFNACFQP